MNNPAYRLAALIGAACCLAAAAPTLLATDIDSGKYMRPEEVRRGMKGFGRTIMAGTEIATFDVEVISVMHNSFYAKQDVILVRCSGLNLEHSGIIAGMSGSPVYLTDDNGRNPRMIGAIAYGWSYNKDPIAGVQPITQMLSIRGFDTEGKATTQPSTQARAADRWRAMRPAPPADSRYAGLKCFGLSDAPSPSQADDSPTPAGVRPLATPIMVSGVSPRTMAFLRERLAGSGYEPVPSGGFGAGAGDADVKLEPGSVLCVPMLTGDIEMDALGTCTEVVGNRVLGFGHAFFGEGPVEMPMATGAVHTVIPSVQRSIKLGASLKTVGTLRIDDNAGIAGVVGEAPAMVPIDVTIREPGGTRTYHYACAQHEFFTPFLAASAISESLFAHRDLPREHTIRYTIDVAFKDLGEFRAANISSESGAMSILFEAEFPMMQLMDNEFGRAKVERVRVEMEIEAVAHTAMMDRVELARDRVKPGAVLEARVQWRVYRGAPVTKSYTLTVPDDLPDGEYELTICSAARHLASLQSEKPYLFRPESMKQTLEGLNVLAAPREDHVYMRLRLPTGGLYVGRDVLPELPSFRQRILADGKRSGVGVFHDALVVEHPAPFVVSGSRTFTITVDRKADQ